MGKGRKVSGALSCQEFSNRHGHDSLPLNRQELVRWANVLFENTDWVQDMRGEREGVFCRRSTVLDTGALRVF